MKVKIQKIIFIILNFLLIFPTIVYFIKNGTVLKFDTFYHFFINEEISRILSSSIYLGIIIGIFTFYIIILKKKDLFKNIKQVLIFVAITSLILTITLPMTSSDIFYYMGVGELDGVYHQNPYYVTMRQYYEQNKENINDEILEKGVNNFWSWTTVVYGPVAQLIFKICSVISLKNVTLCLFVYKFVNLIFHLLNTYFIYKITRKKKFAILYGLNPFILIESIINVHNDIIVVFFVLLALYFLLKKKNLILCVISLGISAGIKYITLLILPFVILYYYREEKNIGKRFLRCVEFGMLFLIVLGVEYLLYFRDFQILRAVLVQTDKYSKSIYSAIWYKNKELAKILKNITMLIFSITYIRLCIKTLIQKDIKFYKIIREYNLELVIFLLTITNAQQWYIMWMFPTIMWQKLKMIKYIIGISFITEIANVVYMYFWEHPAYDIVYVIVLFLLSVIWIKIVNKYSKGKIEGKQLCLTQGREDN